MVKLNKPVNTAKYTIKPMDQVIAEMEAELGRSCEPGQLLLSMANGKDPLYPDRVVPIALRLDAQKTIIKYVRPMLNNIEVTGKDGGPMLVGQIPMDKLMTKDEIVTAMEDVLVESARDARAARQAREQSTSDKE